MFPVGRFFRTEAGSKDWAGSGIPLGQEGIHAIPFHRCRSSPGHHRLFVLSLLVLILWKLFPAGKDPSIPSWIYWGGILLSAFLFAAGHLPFTAQSIGWSGPIIARGLLLNSIGGIGFGYLYWKKGLVYAMIAHAATHFFMQLLFMPLFF